MDARRALAIGLVLGMLILPMISAEIIISQPDALYNLGDEFGVLLEVDEFQDSYFDVDIVCTGDGIETKNLYHGILSEKTISITRELIPVYIGDLLGSCHIEAFYGTDSQISQAFEISDEIDVQLVISELNYMAGDVIEVEGNAVKKTGEVVEGYAEVRLGNESKTSTVVSGGEFNLSFETLETMPAGTYPLIVEIYDKDSADNVLNTGETRADLIMNQELSWIAIATDKEVILPGEVLTIIPFLYDKANYEMEDEVMLKIHDSRGNSLYEKIVDTNSEIIYKLEYNHEPGRSSITVEKGAIISEKVFDVQEAPRVSAELENGSLVVTNIGNVEYDKTIEIGIGGETVLKKVELELGESKNYELEAPSGEYNVIVKDEYETLHQDRVALTGNAINVKEVGSKFRVLARYPLVWLFIIIVLAFVVIIMYKNHAKKKEYSFPVEKPEKPREAKPEEKVKKAEEKAGEAKGLKGVLVGKSNIVKPGAITKAEQVLVLDGAKQDAGIVAIKIKNRIGKEAKETLNKALQTASELKGVACQAGDNFLLIFSPAISKSYKNGEAAVKAAQKIEKILAEHNSKFKERIEHGIGIHVGEIINKVQGEKLKFTSIGPTINIAKRIAKISKGEALLSKDAHKKTRADVKVESAGDLSKIHKMELFKVNRIVDTERNRKFISEFLNKTK